MGFGGFFKYDTPGPGVKKDARQKKGVFVFFEIWARNFWKLIPVSAVYMLLSILLIPSGLANAGLANVCRNLARDKHSFGVSDFFTTIKKNWKQALPAGIINTVVTVLLCYALYFYSSGVGADIWSTIGFGFCAALFIIFTFMKFHIWLLIITFKLPLGKIYKNSFLFTFVNLKSNVIIALVSLLLIGGVAAAVLYIPYGIVYVIAAFLALCVLPGFIGLMTQTLIFPKVKKLMIDPYYEAHPDEDKDVRRGLGLEVEEDDDDAVFDDVVPEKEKKDRNE